MPSQTITVPGLYDGSVLGLDPFVVPADTFYLTLRGWGGGGGSGAGANFTGAGAGASAGHYGETVLPVVPGQVVDFRVGARGAAGIAPGGDGGDGGDTWVVNTSTFLVKGGQKGKGKGGAAGLSPPLSATIATVKFQGGDGNAFTAGSGGAGGGSPGAGSDGGDAGQNGNNTGGAAGRGNPPGAAGANHTGTAQQGSDPGAGASGGAATNTSQGAAGGAGRLIIEWAPFTGGVSARPIHGLVDVGLLYEGSQPIAEAWLKQPSQPIMRVFAKVTEVVVTLSTPGLYRLPVPFGTNYIDCELHGARGGQGAASGGTVMGGVGGAGGVVLGRIPTVAGDVLWIWVGAKGGNGFDAAPGQGGEPGGAGSAQNIFGQDETGLGGTAGGSSRIFFNDEIDPVLDAGSGGGGGAHGTSGAANPGGAGGVGGGDSAGGGHDGQANLASVNNNIGFGGDGGTQAAGGAGGLNSQTSNGGASKSADPGGHLAGGSTFRLGSYGAGTGVTEPHGGGGGDGWFGGGGGGNGSANPSGTQGGAAGGGGGSGFGDPRVENVVKMRGAATGNDGQVILTFRAPLGWVNPFT